MIRLLTVLAILALSGPIAPAHAHAGDDPLRCSLLATASNYEAALQLHARMGTRSLTQYKNDIIARTEEFEVQRLHPPIGESMIARAMAAMSPARRSAFQEWRLVMRSNPWRLPEYPLAEFLTAHRFETPGKPLWDVDVPTSYLAADLTWMQESLVSRGSMPVLEANLQAVLSQFNLTRGALSLRVRQLSNQPLLQYGNYVELVTDFLTFHEVRVNSETTFLKGKGFDDSELILNSRRGLLSHFKHSLISGVSFFTHRHLGLRDWSSEAYPIGLVDSVSTYDESYSVVNSEFRGSSLYGPLRLARHDISHTLGMIMNNQGQPAHVIDQLNASAHFDELIADEIGRQWYVTWVSTSIQALSILNLEAGHTLEIENFFLRHEEKTKSAFSGRLTWGPSQLNASMRTDADADRFLLEHQVFFYQNPSIPHYPNLPQAQRTEIRGLIQTWFDLMKSLRSL